MKPVFSPKLDLNGVIGDDENIVLWGHRQNLYGMNYIPLIGEFASQNIWSLLEEMITSLPATFFIIFS